ncbi:MAG: hypothetical protein ABI593_05810, partial [Betaproteobacteria bacterium]
MSALVAALASSRTTMRCGGGKLAWLAVALVAHGVAGAAVVDRPPTPVRPVDFERDISALQVPFVAGSDDGDTRVAFHARTVAGTLFVTRAGQLVYRFPVRSDAARSRVRGWVLTETLVGAHPVPRSGPAALARVSRFVGNDPAAWKHDVPTFTRVSLGDAWPGVAVDLAARGAGIEKIFTLAPGADAARIAVRVSGAMRLAHDRDGT